MQTDPNFANYLYQPATGASCCSTSARRRASPRLRRAVRARHARGGRRRPRRGGARTRPRSATSPPDDPPERVRAAVDVILLVCEPLRHAGRYDFARLGPAGAGARARLRPGLPPRPAARAAARDHLPAPQARGLVPAARAHRREGRRPRAGLAFPARRSDPPVAKGAPPRDAQLVPARRWNATESRAPACME